MGEDLLGFEPEHSHPQSTERSTAEITAQRCNELLQDSTSHELELELVEGFPEPRPDATPIPRSRASSPRLAHTLPRHRPSNASPGLALAEIETRPVLAPPELPLVAALQNLPPPVEPPSSVPPLVAALQNLPPPSEAPSSMPPSIEAPSSVPPPIEPHWSMPSRVGAPPKFPPAPRTVGDRLALPAMLFVLALGVVAFLLLR